MASFCKQLLKAAVAAGTYRICQEVVDRFLHRFSGLSDCVQHSRGGGCTGFGEVIDLPIEIQVGQHLYAVGVENWPLVALLCSENGMLDGLGRYLAVACSDVILADPSDVTT